MSNQYRLAGPDAQGRHLTQSSRDGAVPIGVFRLFGMILAVWMIAAGLTGYPIPFGDATYFMPASIQLVNGHGFTNPVFDRAREYDALGLARFMYHGFTFELLLAALIKPLMALYATASMASVAALGVIHAAGIVALSEACVPFLRRSQRITLSCCIAAVGLTAFSAMILDFGGRPDELAAMPVCLITLAILTRGLARSTIVLSGVCIGVMASITPIPAALAGLLFSAYLASAEGLRGWLIDTVAAAAIAVLVFFGLTLAIYPYPVMDLVLGIQRHAATVETVFGLHIWRNFIANADLPVFGLVLVLVLVAGTVQAFGTRRRWTERAVLAGLALLFVAILIRFVFNAFLVYNIVPLWPAFLGFLLWSTGARAGRALRDLIWPAAIFVALALPSIGFFRMVLLYPIFLEVGMPQAQAQVLFARQLAMIQEPILFVSRSVFLLTDDYTRIIDYAEVIPEGKVLVITQYRSGSTVPETLPGYRVVYENFYPSPAKLFGITISHTTPGYQFAIYRPTGEGGGLPKP